MRDAGIHSRPFKVLKAAPAEVLTRSPAMSVMAVMMVAVITRAGIDAHAHGGRGIIVTGVRIIGRRDSDAPAQTQCRQNGREYAFHFFLSSKRQNALIVTRTIRSRAVLKCKKL